MRSAARSPVDERSQKLTVERTETSNAIHDEIADRYGYAVEGLASELKYELVRRNVKATDRVLDVGSANGIHLRLVAPLCAEAVGVDINDRMIELARERLAADGIANATVVEASATELPFGDDEFDVVYSFSTLLLVPEVHLALREIGRVVRPGGLALLDVTGRYNLSQVYWRRWYRSKGHFGLNAFSLGGALGALRAVGLDPVEIHGLGITDQWKYVPVLARAEALDRLFHRMRGERDLDYRLSNAPGLRRLANRWYVVARKDGRAAR